MVIFFARGPSCLFFKPGSTQIVHLSSYFILFYTVGYFRYIYVCLFNFYKCNFFSQTTLWRPPCGVSDPRLAITELVQSIPFYLYTDRTYLKKKRPYKCNCWKTKKCNLEFAIDVIRAPKNYGLNFHNLTQILVFVLYAKPYELKLHITLILTIPSFALGSASIMLWECFSWTEYEAGCSG